MVFPSTVVIEEEEDPISGDRSLVFNAQSTAKVISGRPIISGEN